MVHQFSANDDFGIYQPHFKGEKEMRIMKNLPLDMILDRNVLPSLTTSFRTVLDMLLKCLDLILLKP